MKATVDDQRCRGHGVCITICPEVFELTDDGYAVAAKPSRRNERLPVPGAPRCAAMTQAVEHNQIR